MISVGSILAGATALSLAAGAAVAWRARRRNLYKWVGPHLRQRVARRLRPAIALPDGLDLFIRIADHFEPHGGGATDAMADARVAAWVDSYADQLGVFRDSSGRPPRHTFFYPIDQYVPRHVDALAAMCRQGYGEVEVHLHHDHDTAENLEATLRRFVGRFASRHGLLGRHRDDGRVAYGFVHGNWALDNGRPDGRWCGVDDELSGLRQTGCYADFTFTSAHESWEARLAEIAAHVEHVWPAGASAGRGRPLRVAA